ncbi:MAG: DUF4214 domain-containing protein [Solobacterium sp.]|nr:DUF4214 domain-containing protein [Solobacterium sp.]
MKVSRLLTAAALSLSMISQNIWIHAEDEQIPEETGITETAPEETEEPISDISDMEDDAVQAEPVFEFNPMYRDLVTEEEIQQEYEEVNGLYEAGEANALLNASRVCASVSESSSWVKGLMKSRENSFTVTLNVNKSGYKSGDDAFSTVVRQIIHGAMNHTGIGTEGDYLKWHYSSWNANGTIWDYGSYWKMEFDIAMKYISTAAQEARTTAAVNELLQKLNIGADLPDYDKIYRIYEWITANVRYTEASDYSTNMYYHTAYSAIVDKSTVCQGYSSLLYRLALSVGLDCRVVAGDGSTSGSAPHGWNIVKVDGAWYNLDSTWDAGNSPENWEYFLKAASPFKKDHRNWAEYTTADWNARYGVSPTDYSTAKLNKVKEFVSRLYTTCLNRTADPQGLLNWSGLLQSRKKTAGQVIQGFFDSKEYKGRNRSDFDFLCDCYRVLMDREYDQPGLDSWQEILRKEYVSRDFVLQGFVGSAEFYTICGQYGVERGSVVFTEERDRNIGVTRFVVRLYQNALGRNPEVGGLNGWTGRINNASNKKSKAIEIASDGFFHSKEFKNRNTSNEEYVTILYRTFLSREPEPTNNWVKRLNTGMSRDEVLKGFAYSAEFAKLMASYGIR